MWQTFGPIRPILGSCILIGAQPKTLWLASPALEGIWMKLSISYVYTSSTGPKLNYKMHAFTTFELCKFY